MLDVILVPVVSSSATTSSLGSMSRSVLTGVAAHLSSLPPSSTFVVTPGIIDPTCNHGAGAQLSVPPSWLSGSPLTSVVVLPSGITVVAISPGAIAPGTTTAPLIYALTKNCTPDPSFGVNGVEHLKPGNSGHAQRLTLDAMTPAMDGGVIVAGSSAGRWLVGRLGPNGHVDATFGKVGMGSPALAGWRVRGRPRAVRTARLRWLHGTRVLQVVGKRAERPRRLGEKLWSWWPSASREHS